MSYLLKEEMLQGEAGRGCEELLGGEHSVLAFSTSSLV